MINPNNSGSETSPLKNGGWTSRDLFDSPRPFSNRYQGGDAQAERRGSFGFFFLPLWNGQADGGIICPGNLKSKLVL